MKNIKYFFQYILIISLLSIFKLIGFKNATKISSLIFSIIGPLFRSNRLIHSNLDIALPHLKKLEKENITKNMWKNYGKILADYVFIKDFRNSKLSQHVEIKGQEILDKIKRDNEPVIFISGHFNNFELMAMHIDKSGLDLAAIYRPLNNIFINKIMEKIRKNYICKHQIKKGISGIRELIKLQKKNYSTALMIDQRVSEGIKSNFFNQEALTTTIPAQLVKKFKIPVVPIFIERYDEIKFKITINDPIIFSQNKSVHNITEDLNLILEKMILKKPEQWIWSHNRWK